MHARERQRVPCGVAAIATGRHVLRLLLVLLAEECVDHDLLGRLGRVFGRRGGALRMHARERQRVPCGVAAIATGARGLVADVESSADAAATECVLRME